ncbi:MAG: hypothetical protein OXG09_06550 [Chloroflexi bacterium]|nr:hypothetical protein [Chloroflexota bacterium]
MLKYRRTIICLIVFAITVGVVWAQDAAICEGLKTLHIAYGNSLASYLSDKGRECLSPDEALSEEDLITLTSDTRGTWHILTNTACIVSNPGGVEIDGGGAVILVPRIYDSYPSPRLYYKANAGWVQMEGGDLQDLEGSDEQFRLYMEPFPVNGKRLHEFKIQLKEAEDRFAVDETEPALYAIDIKCPNIGRP